MKKSGAPEPAASGLFITAIAADDTTVYIGTLNGGFYTYTIKTEKLTLVRSGLPRINAVAAASSGIIICTVDGVWEYTRGECTKKTVHLKSDFMLRDPFVADISVDDSGHIWIGYFDHGIDVFSSDGTRLFTDRGIRIDNITRIINGSAPQEMLAAANRGLTRYDGFKQIQVLTAESGLPIDTVMAIEASGDDRLLKRQLVLGLILGIQAG